MFGIENYAGFLAAGVLLNMLPGVDSVYVLTRSAAEGKRVGVASVFGISTGVLFHTTLVALGLSAVLAAGPKAFFAVKLAGAAYLLWLGIKTFREKGSFIPTESAEPKKTGLWGAYLQGFLTNALNPKVALFFLAFMPAFVSPTNTYGPLPFLLLGLTFFVTGTLWCLVLVAAGAALKKLLERSATAARRTKNASAAIYCLLGLNVLFARAG